MRSLLLQVLVVVANPGLTFSLWSLLSLGTPFAWKVVLAFYLWALIFLKIPGTKVFKGPATPNGYIPAYAANGLQYYFVSLICFLVVTGIWPVVCVNIYQDFAEIIQVLNVSAMIICSYLMFKGKTFPETQNDPLQAFDKPMPYLFYRGIELHPRLFGVDIKQVQYGTHHSYVLVVHTLRVAENEILKLDFPAKRH
jgi:7-dehydrocholesterol reductase